MNVSATLEVDVPSGATEEDIDSALEVTNLSADDPIAMLSSNPDRFFGRTTKVSTQFNSSPPGLCWTSLHAAPFLLEYQSCLIIIQLHSLCLLLLHLLPARL